MFNSLHAFRLV